MPGPAQPPQPPPFDRRIQIPTLQKLGISFLLLLPVLALLGVFGDAVSSQRAANEQLVLEVTAPERTRYNLFTQVNVEVTNLAAQPVTLTVEFDHSYIDKFSGHVFLPEVQNVTPDAYQVEVPNVPPGERRIITVGMRAEHSWRHMGLVTVTPEAGSPVSIPLRTWVFP
jgi:hypothetical protein